ncbi:MAG: thioesterase [Rhodospirillaceae bacterium]|jgi:acyl-CoA thioester hydrolase|nr:thioesterase [Rhodospirillaceae bacterium]MDP6621281.1 thioesterase family protein [Alphaproteobacteria bacterium]|tara:strand:+ start:1525 stop:1965 length:441 start_codon:yes stop_codon:yes gene_type:complete
MARQDFNFSFPFRVRYAETDAQGVVFYGNYLIYYDTAISEYFRELPFDYMAEVERTGADFHVVQASVSYKETMVYDQEIEVMVRTSRVGRSSLTFALEIYEKGQDTLISTGEIVWVNTDQTSHKSVPMRPELLALIEKREGSAVAV